MTDASKEALRKAALRLAKQIEESGHDATSAEKLGTTYWYEVARFLARALLGWGF